MYSIMNQIKESGYPIKRFRELHKNIEESLFLTIFPFKQIEHPPVLFQALLPKQEEKSNKREEPKLVKLVLIDKV